MSLSKKLMPYFDAFGWVPTIRGALSMKLFDNSTNYNGDVDAYSVAFKTHVDNRSVHFLAATSLASTFDSKAGGDYRNLFGKLLSLREAVSGK